MKFTYSPAANPSTPAPEVLDFYSHLDQEKIEWLGRFIQDVVDTPQPAGWDSDTPHIPMALAATAGALDPKRGPAIDGLAKMFGVWCLNIAHASSSLQVSAKTAVRHYAFTPADVEANRAAVAAMEADVFRWHPRFLEDGAKPAEGAPDWLTIGVLGFHLQAANECVWGTNEIKQAWAYVVVELGIPMPELVRHLLINLYRFDAPEGHDSTGCPTCEAGAKRRANFAAGLPNYQQWASDTPGTEIVRRLNS